MDNNTSSGGIGLAGATFIVFLVLKLVGVIDWSWWWVTSPLWISVALTFFILLIAFLVGAIMDRQSRRKSAELSRIMRQRWNR